MRLSSGAYSDNGDFETFLGLGSGQNGWSKFAIGYVRTGPYDHGDIVFYVIILATVSIVMWPMKKIQTNSSREVGIQTTQNRGYKLNIWIQSSNRCFDK